MKKIFSVASKKRIMKTLIIAIGIFTGLAVYVLVSNRHSKNMTIKQKILKAFYPLVMMTGKSTSGILTNKNMTSPSVSIYDYSLSLIQGDSLHLSDAKGKKILLVNTASNCGYMNQYEELQKLYSLHKNELLIIAFPSNDFKNQEKGTNEQIANFCKMNFGVSFPVVSKGVVSKKEGQQDVYRWLTDKNLNGWNDKAPEWNFSKYLIDEEGRLIKYFPSAVSPMDIFAQ